MFNWLVKLFKKKKTSHLSNPEFIKARTKRMQEYAAIRHETRKAELELQRDKLKKSLEKLKKGDIEGTIQDFVIDKIINKITPKNKDQTQLMENKLDFEKIKKVWETEVPEAKKNFYKTFSDKQIFDWLISTHPDLPQEDHQKVVEMIRSST